MKKILLLTVIFVGAHLAQAQTQVKFYTTMGDFIVEMTEDLTPITSGNFIGLAWSEYYDGIIFHRVIDGFMIQGGDPLGNGTGGPGYSIPDEFDSTLSNLQSTISMANSGPNTGGSQFFINLVDNTNLDFDKPPFTSKHAVFGEVISGFNVVQSIGSTPTDGNDKPITDVVMDSIRIISKPTCTFTLSIFETHATAGNCDGSVTVASSNPYPPFRIFWDSDAGGSITTTADNLCPGTYEVMVMDSSGCHEVASVTIGLVGVEDHEKIVNVMVYPNPVTQASTIIADLRTSENAVLILYDMLGRVISERSEQLLAGRNHVSVNSLSPAGLAPGIYYLHIKSEKINEHQRLLVIE